nr:hypothetical protein [Tanacetum cinerariifolium]
MSSIQSHAATRIKGKENARAPSPPPKLEHKVVNDEEETPREKEIAKLMSLISTSFNKIYKPTNNNLRTSLNTRNKNDDNTPRTDRRTGYERQIGKNKNHRVMNVVEKKDTIGTGTHYLYMAKIQEVIPAANEASGLVFNKEPLE